VASPSTLHHSVKQGNLRRARALLNTHPRSKAVDVNAFDRHGFTPLMYAVQCPAADAEMVRLLLARGARIDLDSRGPLPEMPSTPGGTLLGPRDSDYRR